MTPIAPAFQTAYRLAFHAYVLGPSERSLHAAYELGREAVKDRLSVLDVAVVHHDALAWLLPRASGTDGIDRIVAAASDFFVESVSAFEMVQRGFMEARDVAVRERRQAAMLRQLSSLLADASLALDASGSTGEMLQLVAEQTRELVTADCCVVKVVRHSLGAPIEAVAASTGAEHLPAPTP